MYIFFRNLKGDRVFHHFTTRALISDHNACEELDCLANHGKNYCIRLVKMFDQTLSLGKGSTEEVQRWRSSDVSRYYSKLRYA